MTKDTKNTNADKVAAESTNEKVAAPKVEIIRGRMPLAIVAMIKFGETDLTDGACAAKFRTTNGKVSDVRKNANFGYISEEYIPSADDIAKAVVYAEQLEDKSVAEVLGKMKPATKEQTDTFDTSRKATRKTSAAKDAPADEPTAKELDSLT